MIGIRNSAIHGRGFFTTTEDIKAGTQNLSRTRN